MRAQLLDSTVAALEMVSDPRFHRTERGFQGQFHCALQAELVRRRLVNGARLLEMEPQKSQVAHRTRQRPDIILHIPRESTGANAMTNNVAVWALKRRASASQAHDDFEKLDEMFFKLAYPFGFFVNIDDPRHHYGEYTGPYAERLIAIATWLEQGEVRVEIGDPRSG